MQFSRSFKFPFKNPIRSWLT